jgi:transposase
MRGPYAGELRSRIISFVAVGGSRRELAEQFEIGVSSGIRWMQCFREDGTCEPMPRGVRTATLEECAIRSLALNRKRLDLTLDHSAPTRADPPVARRCVGDVISIIDKYFLSG